MKKSFVLALLLASVPSFALVRLLAYCTTENGKYTISVLDNQGTGPHRTSHIVAQILDSHLREIASYEAKVGGEGTIPSVSFGRYSYVDAETDGHKFLLQGPSTNFPHYSFHGHGISDDKLECEDFAGVPVRHRD